jgi:hypothetical protein
MLFWMNDCQSSRKKLAIIVTGNLQAKLELIEYTPRKNS